LIGFILQVFVIQVLVKKLYLQTCEHKYLHFS